MSKWAPREGNSAEDVRAEDDEQPREEEKLRGSEADTASCCGAGGRE